MIKFFLILIAAIVQPVLASPSFLTPEQKRSDFHQLINYIENSYGPKLYKEEQGIASLKTLVPKYEEMIVQSETDDQFYHRMTQFVTEFKDGHFGIRAPYDYMQYSEALNTDLIEGKVIISKIEEDKLPESLKGRLQVGDEIVSVNGTSTQEVLDELQTYVASGMANSARRVAAWTLLARRTGRMPGFEGGKVEFEVRKGDSKIKETLSMELQEKGSKLPNVEIQGLTDGRVRGESFFADVANLSTEIMLDVVPTPVLDRSFICSGGTRIEKPEGATVIMEKPFVAYYWATDKGNIGYLRVPHYSPRPESEDEKKLSPSELHDFRFEQYEYAVSELEKNTVGLIIDQDHNCGGNVTWLEQFLGLFMNEPYKPQQFRFRASREEYVDWSSNLKESEYAKHTLSYQWWENVVELVKKHWLAGDFLTDFSAFAPDLYKPNRITYTKPIIVLIDELSGSGGDAFPGLIQGYGRAKLLGTTTSGLGGHVVPMPALTFSRMTISMTKSLFYRPDGTPIENNGAVPDIDYVMTVDDVKYGYRAYREFYTQKILEEIQ